jgi:hypothetical protein
MNQTDTTSNVWRRVVELACLQTLALSVVVGGEVLERFAPRLPEVGDLPFLMIKPGYLKWFGLGIALMLNLVFIWAERRSGTEREADSRNATIDRLYAELHQLMSQPTPGADSEIEQRLARLRTLQQEEAAAMRQRYEARSHLKPGMGWLALSQARKLLSENENPSSSNPTLPKQA